jgi:hypothetical protein
MRLALLLTALFLLATPAVAHAPRTGPNGGQMVDAGTTWHAELVTDGSATVVLFLYDMNDKPVAASGFSGNAILIIDGKPHRFRLDTGDGSRLTGTAPVPVTGIVKGAIQLTTPDGSTAQAKF